ncbi:hypothetical protein D9M69_436820 [compost metagenome]
MINLVDHQMTVALLDRDRQLRQLVAGQDRAGRIGRRRHQCADAVVVPMTLDQAGRQLIAHLRTDRHQLCRAFDQPQEMPVTRVARIRQQPVFTGVDQQSAGQQQRAGAARRDEDAPRIDVQTITLLIKARNGLAQLGNAACGGVTGLSRCQRSLAGPDDRFGGGEVRLADFQVDHIVAGGLQFIGPRQQRHDMERFDRATAGTVGLSHWPSFNGKKPILPKRRNEREPKAVRGLVRPITNDSGARARFD